MALLPRAANAAALVSKAPFYHYNLILVWRPRCRKPQAKPAEPANIARPRTVQEGFSLAEKLRSAREISQCSRTTVPSAEDCPTTECPSYVYMTPFAPVSRASVILL